MNKLSSEALKLIFDEPIYVVGSPAIPEEVLTENKAEQIVLTAAPKTTPEAEEPSADYALPDLKGDYASRVLVIVDYENEDFIIEEDQEFLLKVLATVGLNLAKVGILNSHAGLFEKDLDQLKPKTILAFGTIAAFESFQNYIPSKAFGANLLVGHSLSEIAATKDLKIGLWNALKTMFLP